MQGRELRAVGLVVSLVLAGCADEPGHRALPSDGSGGLGGQPVVTTSFTRPTLPNEATEIDILFVVDDSAAMAGVAANLVAQYSAFARVFQASTVGAPPMHVAFVPATLPSSDCSPPDVRAAICGIAPPDQFLTVDYCGVDQNSSRSLADAFACLGNFGAGGCGTPQPLEAARRALGIDPGSGALTGRARFVTPGASLLIVFVTARDDASTKDGALVPVGHYVGFFEGLAGSPDVFLSVIGPEGCPSGASVAATATPRLDDAVRAFGGFGVAQPICDPTLTGALAFALSEANVLPTPPCLGPIKDIDPTRPGLQPDCLIYDDIEEADHSRREIAMPVCDPAAPVGPCLSLSSPGASYNYCPPGSWTMSIVAGPDPVAACGPLSQTVRVSCVTCADHADPACGAL